MVLHKYLWSYVNEESLQKIGQMMGIYKSAVSEYVPCACRAFLKLCYQVNKWRNEAERINISTRIQRCMVLSNVLA